MLEMSICAHPGAGYLICALHGDVGTMFLGDGGRGGQRDWPFTTTLERCFLATEDGEDNATGPSQRTYLWNQVYERVLNTADG